MTTNNPEVWTELNPTRILLLAKLKWHEIVTPERTLVLIPARPGSFDLGYYHETFSDAKTIQYLTISSDFSPEEYIRSMNGNNSTPLGGSPNHMLYHIFPFAKNPASHGPIGHCSIKDINWTDLSFHRGLVIRPDLQGKGIGSQAGLAVLTHMSALGFRTALTEVKEGNKISLKLAKQQFGEGILRDGKYHFRLDLTQPTLT